MPARRLPIVPVFSSAARMPLPGEARNAAVAMSSALYGETKCDIWGAGGSERVWRTGGSARVEPDTRPKSGKADQISRLQWQTSPGGRGNGGTVLARKEEDEMSISSSASGNLRPDTGQPLSLRYPTAHPPLTPPFAYPPSLSGFMTARSPSSTVCSPSPSPTSRATPGTACPRVLARFTQRRRALLIVVRVPERDALPRRARPPRPPDPVHVRLHVPRHVVVHHVRDALMSSPARRRRWRT